MIDDKDFTTQPAREAASLDIMRELEATRRKLEHAEATGRRAADELLRAEAEVTRLRALLDATADHVMRAGYPNRDCALDGAVSDLADEVLELRGTPLPGAAVGS